MNFLPGIHPLGIRLRGKHDSVTVQPGLYLTLRQSLVHISGSVERLVLRRGIRALVWPMTPVFRAFGYTFLLPLPQIVRF